MNIISTIRPTASWQKNGKFLQVARNTPGSGISDTDHRPDLGDVIRYRYKRLQQQIVDNNCAGAMIMGSVGLRYTTGSRSMAVFNLHSPYRGVFVPPEGKATLFDWGDYGNVGVGGVIGEVRAARTMSYFPAGEHYSDVCRTFAKEIADLAQSTGNGQTIAMDICEPELALRLADEGITIINADRLLDRAASIKSEDEIKLMAMTVSIAEAGLYQFRKSLEPGVTEQEAWANFHHENIRHGGEWCEYRLVGSGGRTNPWGQGCTDRMIRAGELVAIDTGMIGPWGYGADMSRTFFCEPGVPTDEQKRIYNTALEEIGHNLDQIKAGITFREFSEKSFRLPDEFWARRYPVISHGIGMGDEWPAIPHFREWEAHGDEGVLESGMVISVESCIGREDGVDLVKLEEMVVVRDGGFELLSTFPFETALLQET